MDKVSLKELLEAGCHFGHQSQRWHPKAEAFIYTRRDGIHIIDLVKTRDGLLKACDFIIETLGNGGKIIFSGTKRQAKDIIRAEAQRCGAFFVSEHWPAGMFTNFPIMKKNLDKMWDLREKLADPEKQKGFTKKEVGIWAKDLKKLELQYGGIADLKKVPEILFVIDIKKEAGAVREAVRMGVKVIGVTDTNSDPTSIDFPIPANDDAVGSITILTKYIADAVAEGMKLAERNTEIIKNKEKIIKEEKEVPPAFAKATAGKQVSKVPRLPQEDKTDGKVSNPEPEQARFRASTEELKEQKTLKVEESDKKESNTETLKTKKTLKSKIIKKKE